MLATHALYPIIKAFCSQASVEMELKDISVAGRVLALFPERLQEQQRTGDFLQNSAAWHRVARQISSSCPM